MLEVYEGNCGNKTMGNPLQNMISTKMGVYGDIYECLWYGLKNDHWYTAVIESFHSLSAMYKIPTFSYMAHYCHDLFIACTCWLYISVRNQCCHLRSHNWLTANRYVLHRLVAVFADTCRCKYCSIDVWKGEHNFHFQLAPLPSYRQILLYHNKKKQWNT